MEYKKHVEIRWSDLDPNYHLKHSSYYDFGAYCRINFLYDNGITDKLMRAQEIGPILFREECFFKKEIVFGDAITIDLKLKSVSKDSRKFSMQHQVFKNENILAAVLVVDAAWMSTRLRRIITPPEIIIKSLDVLDRTDDFVTT